jgi:hypothetical protein
MITKNNLRMKKWTLRELSMQAVIENVATYTNNSTSTHQQVNNLRKTAQILINQNMIF